AEFKEMVARFHDAGLEVILDVVYNHTAEGNHLGPTLSFKGIDNASYYWLMPDKPRYYDDFTGTGNALNLTHPRVLQMVMDSLRYWVEVCRVDGFRFDLATTLGRTPHGFDRNAAFFAAVRQDPVLGRVKLIAEPWDVGLGGYQVGNFPTQWSEWNDSYRSTLRRFWRGDGSLLGDLARRMTGSADLFQHHGRAPRASINHITVHDGFTLADLVSYETKHNEANGEENRDGSDHNDSTNCGIEGPTDDPSIVELRRTLRRAQIACLMLAQGVPLLLAGDEVGNSQGGNNNAYCQDNEVGWVDWSGLGREGDDLTELVRSLALLRRTYPQLRPRHWLQAPRTGAPREVMWFNPQGEEMTEQDWHFPEGRFLAYVLGTVEPSPGPLLIVLNGAAEPVAFKLPVWPDWNLWRLEIATVEPDGLASRTAKPGSSAVSPARSVMVFSGSR
ncbi:MAG TPA: glycogen debranching protein GlgX, partial [Xanthobacteraceae bacterium]|nr:glycogen debranching protein GlgX [Xanthobacteraceae bacterium]